MTIKMMMMMMTKTTRCGGGGDGEETSTEQRVEVDNAQQERMDPSAGQGRGVGKIGSENGSVSSHIKALGGDDDMKRERRAVATGTRAEAEEWQRRGRGTGAVREIRGKRKGGRD